MEQLDHATCKKKLELDWPRLLSDSDGDDPLPVLIITASTANAECGNPSGSSAAIMDADHNGHEDMENMTDQQLDNTIIRVRNMKKNRGHRLPDKGARLDVRVERLEDEKERRKHRRVDKDLNECGSTTQSATLTITGTKKRFPDASDALRKEQTSSNSQSLFGKILSKNLDDADGRTFQGFDKVSAKSTSSDRRKNWRRRRKASSRNQPFQSPKVVLLEKVNQFSGGDQRRKFSTTYSPTSREFFATRHAKKENEQFIHLDDSKPTKDQMVVLDDEDDCRLETIKRADEVAESKGDATISYPSRDDPDSVDICYKDTKCLGPEVFLTSPIMNFYIIYLQQRASSSNKGISDYHFFNTYFYKKLKEAISDTGSGKDVSFAKFRRWWKGVNIFEKAYVFIPIHEALHWSLAIICIPDKEDESGLIILHLDSLQLHESKSIFGNIKRFLIEEWSCLNQESASLDLIIVDKVWERLPSQIGEETIRVPQQKNAYDCGLFVLYFMQRFIEEAPERLRKRDLAMFGRRWFKPEEASSLRSRIWRLLVEEFQKAARDQAPTCSSFSSSDTDTSDCMETS